MNKRSRLFGIIGASVLTLGIAGIALATDLLDGQVGIELGSKPQDCSIFPEIGPGEVGVHFVLSQPDADSGLLDASFSTDSFTGLASYDGNSNSLQWFAVITGDLNTTILSAHTDVDGKNLVLSHVCGGTETSSSTSFSSSEESSTTSVQTSSSASTTSFSSSEESSTTSVVTTPPTDTIFDGGSGNQATGMWLLVAALGVLLGSLVVVAPARAKR